MREQQKCVNPCPGQWLSENSCSNCHPTCSSCFGPRSRSCLECNSGYLLNIDTRQCSKNCPRKYYKHRESQTCRSCHHSCGTCVGPNADQCTSCSPKLQFFNNTCSNDCPIGWYSNFVSPVCQVCSTKCKSCKYNADLCTECNDEQVWHDYKCFDRCRPGMFRDHKNKRCYR